jgi:hypothetical protein
MMHIQRIGLFSVVFHQVAGFNHLVDPCKLICHLENSIDLCKLVSADGPICRNAFWTDEEQESLVIDIVFEDDAIPVLVDDAISILRAPRGGCEKLCKFHDSCIETGSNCKENDTCLNLFWRRGRPDRGNMTTCHSLDFEADCPDVAPVLCGNFDDIKSLSSEPTGDVNAEVSNRLETNESQTATRGVLQQFDTPRQLICLILGILSTLL